jgi:uncharacterized protein
MTRPRFHLAIPVTDLSESRSFYRNTLGFAEGRSDVDWVDFDMYGHQLVIHRNMDATGVEGANEVDGDHVPIPHFGVVLSPTDWYALAERLRGVGIEFVVKPHVRFEGQAGEQLTMFLLDPSGNALEFKSFADDGQVFAT